MSDRASFTAWTRRSFRWRLGAIVALGGAWRLGYVLATRWGRSLLLNDSLYYSWQARGLVHGEYFKDIYGVREAAEHGPLTSIVLAPVSVALAWLVPVSR